MASQYQTLRGKTGEFLSVAEVAERLDISASTVRNGVKDGSIPALPGKPIRVPRQAFEALMHTGKGEIICTMPDPAEYAKQFRAESLRLTIAAAERELAELEKGTKHAL